MARAGASCLARSRRSCAVLPAEIILYTVDVIHSRTYIGRKVIEGDYEWDDAKAARNVTVHDGVTFHDAVVALEDPGARAL